MIALLLCIAVEIAMGAYLYFGAKTTNPEGYGRVEDIVAPSGYERQRGSDDSFSSYLRSLPLKPKGAKVQLFTGGDANLQNLAYAVVNLPLLSNAEQCADCCYRLRSEYLYQAGKFSQIAYKDVNGNMLRYGGDVSRKSFESYLRSVYNVASTFSLSRFLPTRQLHDMQIGDVFVFAAADRPGYRYGHAVMVVDMAVNKEGKKVFLLAEGNTPAREIHVMRNWKNPFLSPWFQIDSDDTSVLLSCFRFENTELRGWE